MKRIKEVDWREFEDVWEEKAEMPAGEIWRDASVIKPMTGPTAKNPMVYVNYMYRMKGLVNPFKVCYRYPLDNSKSQREAIEEATRASDEKFLELIERL